MDIIRPPLEQQVAPTPWLVARSKVDVPALIRRVHTEQPDASVDDIVRQLSDWGVQVSGIIVSMWVMKWKQEADQGKPNDLSGKTSGNAEAADLLAHG